MTRPKFTDPDGGTDVDSLPTPQPCPFCGNDALPSGEHGYCSPIWIYGTPYVDGTGRILYTVECVRCQATGPSQLSAEYAAYQWNKRALGAVDPTVARERSLPGVSLH